MVQLFSTGLIYQWQRMSLKQEQATRIATGRFDHKGLAVITTHPDALIWVNEKEFIYEGSMYDLVSYSEQHEVWQIAALKDTEEDALKLAYEVSMQTSTERGHPKAQPLKLIPAPYILPATAMHMAIPVFAIGFEQNDCIAMDVRSSNILSPPPEA